MEQQDLELIQTLLPENEELARLWAAHNELGIKVDAMSSRVYLSPEEELELKQLKKVKLSGRDRIEAILAQYRAEQAGS